MPGFYLKKMIMENFTSKEVDPDIADSIDFMVENVSMIQTPLNTHARPVTKSLHPYFYAILTK